MTDRKALWEKEPKTKTFKKQVITDIRDGSDNALFYSLLLRSISIRNSNKLLQSFIWGLYIAEINS